MMPDKKRYIGANPDPHFDGELENVINDSLGTQSTQMGVVADKQQTDNPFHVTETNNDDMKEFEKLTRGNKVDIDD